nr:MAG TPA: hypothetical protein [Caudoviricetes sp.]
MSTSFSLFMRYFIVYEIFCIDEKCNAVYNVNQERR